MHSTTLNARHTTHQIDSAGILSLDSTCEPHNRSCAVVAAALYYLLALRRSLQEPQTSLLSGIRRKAFVHLPFSPSALDACSGSSCIPHWHL